MGENILTPHQHAVVELTKNDRAITADYYLTGGTALTVFYLKHRLSDDLDYFTEGDVNVPRLRKFFEDHQKTLGISAIRLKEHHNMVFFFLTFEDGSTLKVDFVNFPYSPIEQGERYGNLRIDSVFDIAINKLYTLSDNPRARDYVDLYMILTKQDISLEQVYNRLNDKFYPFTFDDTVSLGIKLSRVLEVKDFPNMLIPFDPKAMIDFFLAEAKKLGKKIFK